MRFFLNIILVSLFVTSCNLVSNVDTIDDVDYSHVNVDLKPDTTTISDELVFTLSIVNNTDVPIWYNYCGQVREVLINSEWKPTQWVVCDMEPEGIRIDARHSFETTITDFLPREPEIFRLVLNLKDKDRELLPREVRRTNSVTILYD